MSIESQPEGTEPQEKPRKPKGRSAAAAAADRLDDLDNPQALGSGNGGGADQPPPQTATPQNATPQATPPPTATQPQPQPQAAPQVPPERSEGDEEPQFTKGFEKFLADSQQQPTQTKAEIKDEKAAAREAQNRVSPALRRMGGDFARKAPGGEHMEIWKRKDDGQLGMVGEYNAMDIAGSQNMTSFIYRYVAPKYGPGNYECFAVDARGNRVNAGVVIVEPEVQQQSPVQQVPAVKTEDTSVIGLLKQMMDRQETRERELIEFLRSSRDGNREPVKDPIQQARAAADLAKEIGSVNGDGGLGLVAQMMGQMTTMMTTMMTEMRKESAKSDPLPPMPPTPPVDPIQQVKTLAEALRALQPPVPAVAPQDPIAQLESLARVAAIFQPKQDDRVVDLLMKERMTPTDVINMFEKMRGQNNTTTDFKQSINNFTELMEVAGRLKNLEGGGPPSIGETVAAIMNTRAAGALAGAVQAKLLGSGQPPQQAQQGQQGNDELAQRERAVRERMLKVAEMRVAEQEKKLATGVAPTQQLQQPEQPATEQPAQQPAAEQQAPAAQTAQSVPAQSAAAPAQSEVPPLPPEIVEYINPLVEAKEEGELVEGVVDLLTFIAQPEAGHLSRYGQHIMEFILAGNGPEASKYVRSLFAGLQGIKMISQEVAVKAVTAFEAHFDEVVAYVQEETSDDGEADAQSDGGQESAAAPPG